MSTPSQADLEQLTQASYARSFGELQQTLDQQEEINTRALISAQADMQVLENNIKDLEKQLQSDRDELIETEKNILKLQGIQESLQQQSQLMADYQALAENRFQAEKAQFFRCSTEQMIKTLGATPEKLKTALSSKQDTGIFSFQDQHYCCISTPEGHDFFHPQPIDPDKLFPKPETNTNS